MVKEQWTGSGELRRCGRRCGVGGDVCVLQVPVDHGKASGFYSKCNGMPAEGFVQGCDKI